MHRRFSRNGHVVVLAAFAASLVVLGLFAPTSAQAVFTNSQCLTCHSSVSGLKFQVGDVVKDTACRKCHTDSLVGTHPYHNPVGNCGAQCHDDRWGASLSANRPMAVTSAGSFAGITSQDTTAAVLHIIHSTPRWPARIVAGGQDCGACHAAAACDACHENAPAPDTATHAQHGSTDPTIVPWSGDVARGGVVGRQTGASVRCGAAGCHNTSGVAASAALLKDNMTHGAFPADGYVATVVNKVGTWTPKYGSVYSMGQQVIANAVTAQLSTTFTGERVVLVSDKDPYRGVAQILIDGAPAGTVDLYESTTKYQVAVWTSAKLGAGSHTVTVRPTGTKNASARAAFVSVDLFKVYSAAPGSIAPTCLSCHPGFGEAHGAASTFSHEASPTAGNLYNGGTGNYRCDSCHALSFYTEHNRTSSTSTGKSCGNCHTTYAGYTWTDTWNGSDGCNFGACHAVSSARQPHTAQAADHAVGAAPAEQPCRDCHAGDLGAVHNNSIAANAYTTNCNTCHAPTKFPSTNSCSNTSGCHATSGVGIVDDHARNATYVSRHTATTFTSAFQSPGPDGAISTGGKDCSVCHSARLDTAHVGTSAGTVGCTTGGTGNTGCHYNTSLNTMTVAKTGWSTDKCAECHDYGSSTTHNAYGTTHVVPAGSCAGTGASCHNYTDLATLHMFKQSGSATTYNSCSDVDLTDPTPCHNVKDKRPTRWATNATSCGLGSDGCHQEKTTDNHAGKHTLNLSGSNYADGTQAGCTNSGAGCHGAATSTNIADYHGSSGCTSGPCHTSADKGSHHEPFVCTDCHDGTYQNAADRTALRDVDPAGHYNETTHTATPAGSVSAGGTYSATCVTCHAPGAAGTTAGLYTQHQGIRTGSLTCSGCHNKNAAIQTIVTDAVRTNTCAPCHDGTVVEAQHGATAPAVAGIENTGAGTCAKAGCHSTTDLHALHKSNLSGNANGCTMANCHSTAAQGAKPTAKSCGDTGAQCHSDKTATNHGKKHNLTIASSVYADGLGEGVAAGCLTTGGGGCHDSLGAGNTSTDIADYHQTALCATSACHVSADKPTHTQPFVCTDCHDGTYSGAVDTVALGDSSPAGHYVVLNHTATGGLGNVSTGGTAQETCSVCHDLSLAPAHTGIAATTKGTKVTCAECHAYNINVTAQVKTANWTNNACSDCHSAGVIAGSVQHASTLAYPVAATGSAGCASSGRNCHNTSDLHLIHTNSATGCDLAGCHDAAHKNIKPTDKSCGASGACHKTGFNTNTTFPTHTPAETSLHAPTNATQEGATWTIAGQTNACGACHIVSSVDGGLLNEHVLGSSIKSVNATNICLNCHNSAASDTAVATGWALNRDTVNACLQCHTAANSIPIHSAENATAHTDVTSASCGNTGAGCHPTDNLAQTGTPSTTANIHTTCLRCHDHAGSATVPAPGGGNMQWDPAKDTCGQGRECHNIGTQYPTAGDPIHRNTLADAANGDDTTHHTGVTANKTNYPESGTGVYSDNLVCAGCHSNTLKAAHAATSTNGGAVTCLECHNGSGAITQATAAGQVKGDWTADKCTDCHAAASTHASFKSGAGYSANHVATMNAGCVGSGTGCHGTRPDSLTAVAPAGEMVQLHTTPGCSASSGTATTSCHALNKPMNTVTKTCGTGSNCHNTYTTTAGHASGTINGNDAAHTVTTASMDVLAEATYTLKAQCKECHSSTMTNAHTGVTVAMESTNSWAAAATPFCTNCHNATTPDNAASVIKTTTWAKTCDACHVTSGDGKHARYTAATHTATTSGCTLTTGCHGYTSSQSIDIRSMHNASAGCTATGTDSQGWSGACHALNKSMTGTTMTCGDTGACHNAHTPSNHMPDHDGDKALGTAVGTTGQTYDYGTNVGCFKSGGLIGCHFSDLRLEHGTTAYLTAAGITNPAPVQRAMDGARGGSTDGCTVCHATGQGTAGAYAARSAIVAAVTNGDYRCTSCHFETSDAAGTTGVQRPHASTQVITPASQGTTYEFTNTTAGGNDASGGGHNAFGAKFPNTGGFGTVNGLNVTGTWAFGGTLRSPWTTSSIVKCVDCHEKAATPNGPQGASVPYYISSGGTAGAGQTTVSNWAHTTLVRNMTTTIPAPCNKCHTDLSAGLHDRSAHATNMQCRNCHVEIAHAWRRPRLLRRTIGDDGSAGGSSGGVAADTAPYVDTAADGTAGYIRGLIVDTGAPTPAQGNCVTGGCNAHNASFSSGTLWP